MGLSRSFQITSLFHRLSVFENIRCALLWSRGYGYSIAHLLDKQRELNGAAEILLERLGSGTGATSLQGYCHTQNNARSRSVLRIAGGADLILLDEPTAGMNRNEADHAAALIRQLTEGKTLIIVEHDMSVVFDLADVVSVLVYGQIIASDVPARIRTNPSVREAYLGTKAA
jgi:branched-chain amino acid transport system ATP-binding protein